MRCTLQCGAVPVRPDHKSMSGFTEEGTSISSLWLTGQNRWDEVQRCSLHWRPLLDKSQKCHRESLINKIWFSSPNEAFNLSLNLFRFLTSSDEFGLYGSSIMSGHKQTWLQKQIQWSSAMPMSAKHRAQNANANPQPQDRHCTETQHRGVVSETAKFFDYVITQPQRYAATRIWQLRIDGLIQDNYDEKK